MMWDCEACGCLAIAASVAACPMCGKERVMPRITVGGGPSNADADQEAAPEAPPEDVAEEQDQPEGDATPRKPRASQGRTAPRKGKAG